MPSSLLYNNFSSGILGKKLRRNVTSQIYQNSAKKLENVVPLTTGGVKIRPGLRRLIKLDGYKRIIPFVISSDEYYLVCVSDKNSKILSFLSFDFAVDDQNDFTSPWSTDTQMDQIYFTQNSDRLIMTQIDNPPQVVEKSGLGFSFSDLQLEARTEEYTEDEDGTKTYINYDYAGLFTQSGQYPSLCAYCNERLWLISTHINPYRLYASRPYQYNNFQMEDRYQVPDSSTTVSEYLEAINGSGKTIKYFDGNDNPVTDEKQAKYKHEITVSIDPTGYKYTETTIYEKAESAGDPDEPTTEIVWEFVSTSTKAEKYTETKMMWEKVITDECAMYLEPASDRNDSIAWIAAASRIFYGTLSNIFIMNADISPNNKANERTGSYGSTRIQPAMGNSYVYYAAGAGKQVRAITYGYYGTQYAEISKRAEELFNPGIKRMVWQSVPEPRLYVVLKDGSLAVLVDDGSGNMAAWCHWNTRGNIDDIAVLDTENGQSVYILVTRDDGTYVEVFEDGLYLDEDEPIECDVVLNPVEGGSTLNFYKSISTYFVDSMGTEFMIGQEGCQLEYIFADLDNLLTRVNAYNNPAESFCIEIKNIPEKDFTILCVATEVEVL